MWAKARDENGRRAIDQPWVQRALADCYTRLEAQRLLNFRIAADVEAGNMDVALASASKVYGSETVIEVLRMLIEVMGSGAMVRAGSAAALLAGELEYEARAATITTFGGGTNELQRELIAQFGLAMPKTIR
jgi:3-oxocholest-4-en-26-oyl-CoA dehydrogenase alpha subunit